MWRQSVLIALLVSLASAWEIAVTAGDRIEFYTADGNKIDAVHFPSQNLTAVAYDEVHDMLLYVDKQSGNDAICGYKMSFQEYQCYVERNGRNIQGLAFDPATDKLFFTDTNERSINWFSFKPGFKNNALGNLLIKLDEGIPTDIVVDSCRGFIYWINRNITTSTIERARFDGSKREVVIKASFNFNLHSLAIDQLTQKIFWIEAQAIRRTIVNSADLNGKNWKTLKVFYYASDDILLFNHPNTLTVLKENIFSMSDWCKPCNRHVWKIAKSPYEYTKIFRVETKNFVGIAANYKMKDQFQGISHCSHISVNETTETLKIAREYDFCVHGKKDIGQSICKCTAGYKGVRCETSVCENHCFQGQCSVNEEGISKCRCNAGYTGERCEVNVCNGYCLNDGNCSLNGNSEPVCHCTRDYLGKRCEVSACESFCLHGKCSVTEEGIPTCRCNAGYTGERCEVNVCNGYCLNDGTCSLNEEDDPMCECVGAYKGRRCEVLVGVNSGEGYVNDEDRSTCQCVGGRKGSERDADTNTISNTSSGCLGEGYRNLTLGQLLDNWHAKNLL